MEIKELIDTAFIRAKDILRKNSEGHKQLAELLLEREVIFTEDLEKIFGARPWGKKKDEELPFVEAAILAIETEPEV